ncbi:MAG: hypothetical protein M1816_005015 [Peltula sp. TS41687]|nr:MAG: hypothetical protein M1816_005015 [Peltula sp. TS41687]
MKLSTILVASCSVTSSLAVPIIIPRDTADSNKGDVGKYVVGGVAGAVAVGGVGYVLHLNTVNKLKEDHAVESEEVAGFRARQASHTAWHRGWTNGEISRFAQEKAKQSTAEGGKRKVPEEKMDPEEEGVHELLRNCFFRWYKRDIWTPKVDWSNVFVQEAVWSTCREDIGIRADSPAYQWGPNKEGLYVPDKPGVPSFRDTPDVGEEGPLLSRVSFSAMRDGIVGKAKQAGNTAINKIGHFLTNVQSPAGGFIGGPVEVVGASPVVALP